MQELIKTIDSFKKLNDLSKMKQNLFQLSQRDLSKSPEEHIQSETHHDLSAIFYLLEKIDNTKIDVLLID